MATVRPTAAAETSALPELERSAGEAFRTIPELAWLADDELTSVADHDEAVAAGTSWVAEESGRPVGFVIAEVVERELHVRELAVSQPHQRRGLGARLMETVIESARQRGLEALTLTTFQDVRWNQPFYARLGFATLAADAAGPRLQALLAAEAQRGLPRRCAMRLMLRSGG